jgi:hypothetical protein
MATEEAVDNIMRAPMPTLPVLEMLETALGKPVISNDVASATISLTICCGVGGRPRCLPRASAARIPAVTRSLISEDSNSAMAPMMVNIARPMQIKVTAPALPRALSRLAAAPYDACEKRAGMPMVILPMKL